eukprot:m.18657 g.18657  ORF g.18657 m.18657 type:complete len:414 (+) comp6377_c0_seq1:214-1455(+)
MQLDAGARERMDLFLAEKKKWRKPVARDGSCLFRAVADHVYHCQARHMEIRSACVKYLREHAEDYQPFIEADFEVYLFDMEDTKTWGGNVEISALSQLFNLQFCIFRELPFPSVDKMYFPYLDESEQEKSIHTKQIEVCYSGNNHYDLVCPSKYKDHAVIVMDLIYNILEEKLGIPKPKNLSKKDYVPAEYETWRLTNKTPPKQLKVGSKCEAKYPDDEKWYEAVIRSIAPDRAHYGVEFTGYNDGVYQLPSLFVRTSGSRRLPSKFVQKIDLSELQPAIHGKRRKNRKNRNNQNFFKDGALENSNEIQTSSQKTDQQKPLVSSDFPELPIDKQPRSNLVLQTASEETLETQSAKVEGSPWGKQKDWGSLFKAKITPIKAVEGSVELDGNSGVHQQKFVEADESKTTCSDQDG